MGIYSVIEEEIIENKSTVADIKSELDCTDTKYNDKSQEMARLATTLSVRTSKLVEKSFVLSKIEESFFECDDESDESECDDAKLSYQQRLVKAKTLSEVDYIISSARSPSS